jgi:hypothetical protein
MTETEWLACTNPMELLRWLGRRAGKRKRRLFGCACCRRVWHLIPDERSRAAVVASEQFADGLVSEADLEEARRQARLAHEDFEACGPPYERLYTTAACVCAVKRNAGDAVHAWYGAVSALQMAGLGRRGEQGPGNPFYSAITQSVWDAERTVQSHLVRDLFANPFAPPALDPAWRDRTVQELALGIYEEHAFDRMPILGDALEDAGCHDTVILSHCRDDRIHARGCWLLDQILGKG